MPRTKSAMSGQLSAAQTLITNTRADAEIKALVAAYGYNDPMLNEGQGLYDAAKPPTTSRPRPKARSCLPPRPSRPTRTWPRSPAPPSTPPNCPVST